MPPVLSWLRDKYRAHFRSLPDIEVVPSNFPLIYEYGDDSDRHSLPWYRSDNQINNALTPEMRAYYEERTGLEGRDFEAIFLRIRDAAWRVDPDPMFGTYWFAKDTIRKHPYYSELLKSLRDGATLIELDCRLGQNLRYLAHDGAPTQNMWAIDSHEQFWPLGRALFGDMAPQDGDLRLRPANEKFQARFIHASFRFGVNQARCVHLRNKADIILAVHVLNNFEEAHLRMVLRDSVGPYSKPGTVFMGLHLGAEKYFVGRGGQFFYDNRGRRGYDFVNVAQEFLRPRTPGDQKWQMLVCEAVDLSEWGFGNDDVKWIREGDGSPPPKLHGIHFAFRRIE